MSVLVIESEGVHGELRNIVPCRQGWYEGLSDAFLGVKVPKVLMLAGTDRLDRTLTIGQMQGRFQLVLLPQARICAD